MAGISTLTTGYNTSVAIDEKAIGVEAAKVVTLVPHVQSIGDLTDVAASVTVNEYGGDGYTQTLAGIKTAGPVDLVLNYVPTDATQALLKTMYDGASQGTMKITYKAGQNETYVTFNFNVLSFSIASPVDGVRAVTCSIGVLGKYTITQKV